MFLVLHGSLPCGWGFWVKCYGCGLHRIKTLVQYGQLRSIDRPNISSILSTGGSFRFPFLRFGDKVAMTYCGLKDSSDGNVDGTRINSWQELFNPKCLLHLGAFNVCKLNQIGQQATWVRTFKTFKIGVFCVSETRTQDHTPVITLGSPNTTSFFRFWFRTFVVRLVWDPPEHASKVCTVRLDSSRHSFLMRFS